MATRKIDNSPAALRSAAIKAAQDAIAAKGKLDGFSKRFTAAVLRLAAQGTDESRAEGENLGVALAKLTGGASYASNAKRILAATPAAARKALEACEDDGGSGFPAPAGLFKKFPEEFPSLSNSGRPAAAAAAAAAAANDSVSLNTPAGWTLALTALCANVQGQKSWTNDDIAAARDSAQRILAIIKRNAA
jgi:hypothetical protein